jgi:hypothetical protein
MNYLIISLIIVLGIALVSNFVVEAKKRKEKREKEKLSQATKKRKRK